MNKKVQLTHLAFQLYGAICSLKAIIDWDQSYFSWEFFLIINLLGVGHYNMYAFFNDKRMALGIGAGVLNKHKPAKIIFFWFHILIFYLVAFRANGMNF